MLSNLYAKKLRCSSTVVYQVILAGTLTGVQGNIRCKVLAALSTVKYLLVTCAGTGLIEGCN